MTLFGIFMQREEKTEKDADGKENAANPVPRQPLAVVQVLDEPHCNKCEANAVGQSDQQLHDCAGQQLSGISTAPQMKKKIEQGGKGESDIFLNGFHLMLAELAYIFPDARPKDNMLHPLVQLFRQIVHLAPVENDLPEALPPLAEALLAQGQLRFDCPAPLGNDRARFVSLINEIRHRPADYAGLALSGFGAPETAESRNAIISAIRRQQSGMAEQKWDEALWQVRLVLKLGEIVEQREEEIRQSLRQVALREQSLLQALRDEQTAAASSGLDRPAESRRSRLRLKAWRKLLAASSGPLLSNLFITADHEAFAAVMEEGGAEARQMVTLSLPAHPAAGSFAAAQRQDFRQAAAEMISSLPASFAHQAWETLLEQHYPAAEHGRCRLFLHLLPGPFFADQGAQSANSSTVLGFLESVALEI